MICLETGSQAFRHTRPDEEVVPPDSLPFLAIVLDLARYGLLFSADKLWYGKLWCFLLHDIAEVEISCELKT